MRKMSITNSVTAAMEFLTDSLSSFKFRSNLIDETVERTLVDSIRDRTSLEGIVVSANAQKTNLAADQNDEDVFLAAKIRISAIHDEMFPSPVEFAKMKKSPKKIRQLIDAHPVIYSKDGGKSVGTSPTRGQRVSIEFIDGVPRWTIKSGKDLEYALLKFDDYDGTAQNAYKNQQAGLVGDRLATPSWNKGTAVLLNSEIERFLDQFVANLAAEGWTQFPIFVSSGVRTVKKQAEIMVENVSNNQKWWPYGSTKLRTIIFDGLGYKISSNGAITKKAAKIGRQNQKKLTGYNVSGPSPIAQYETLTKNFTKQDLLDEVQVQINANILGGQFISAHLSGQALDIATKKINKASVGVENIESSLALLKRVAIETSGKNGSAIIELYEGSKWTNQKAKRDSGEAEALSFEHLHIRLGDGYTVSD